MNTIMMMLTSVWGPPIPATKHDERGLSESTESAILVAGAVAIGILIVTVITAFVESKLPS